MPNDDNMDVKHTWPDWHVDSQWKPASLQHTHHQYEHSTALLAAQHSTLQHCTSLPLHDWTF